VPRSVARTRVRTRTLEIRTLVSTWGLLGL
jgi:hypothetical protein